MNLLESLLSSKIIAALGWTLVHSLWQGALAALGFAFILYLTRKYSSRARYGLGLMTLALVLILSAVTFWNQYSAPDPVRSRTVVEAGAVSSAMTAAPEIPLSIQPSAPGRLSFPAKAILFFRDYFSRNLPLIVTLWLLGVLFLTLRFAGSFLYAQRLKHHQTRMLPKVWQERLDNLRRKIGLRKPVRLLESLRLRSPITIGCLKPVILLPAGMVTGLPLDEVEALLAHELAHILRNDYLLNILQNLADILFFFHPGIRWISLHIRQEREHCCDDFAVSLCGDSVQYAKALTHLQNGANSKPEPALAAVGPSHRLFRRVKRLLGRPRLAPDFREGFVSALFLVLCLFGTLKMTGAAAGASAEEIAQTAVAAAKSKPEVNVSAASRFACVQFVLETDSLVNLVGERTTVKAGSAGTWLVDESDGQVIWYMDLSAQAKAAGENSFNEEVSLGRGTYSWYRPAGWKATSQWRDAAKKGSWEPLTMFVGSKDPLLRHRNGSTEMLIAQQEEKKLREEELRARQEELREREMARQAKMKEGLLRQEEGKLRDEQERLQAEQLRAQAELERSLREQEQRLRAEEDRLKSEEAKFRKFMAELVADNLIRQTESYEIKLSGSAMVVNGQKQPPAVLEKYKKLYESLTGKKVAGKRTITIINEKD